MKYRYLVGLGSNERAEQQLPAMIESLLTEFGEIRLSPVCKTEAVSSAGVILDSEYLNAVASFESDLSSEELRDWCKTVEARLGRVRPSSLCAADMDILLCSADEFSLSDLGEIEEPYFQPLARAVVSQTSDISGSVELFLVDGRSVGHSLKTLR